MNKVIATIPVGVDPRSLILSPDGERLYVVNFGSNNISVIDTLSNKVINTFQVGSAPGINNIAIDKGGLHLYIPNNADNTVSIVDTSTDKVSKSILVGNSPISSVITPDDGKVFVANMQDNSISVINTQTEKLESTIENVGKGPLDMAITPDGKKIYITNSENSTVTVLDALTYAIIDSISLNKGAFGVVISPDGNKAYVSNNNCCGTNGSVTVINTNDNSILTTITVGLAPDILSLNFDGSRLYVPNNGCCGNPLGNNVSVIDTLSNTVMNTIVVGLNPYAVAVGKVPVGGGQDLNVLLLKQTDDPWGSQIYDSAKSWNPADPRIYSWGCALTSAVMVLRYHGLIDMPDGTELNPETVNAWLLKQPDGYIREGWVNWLALSRLSKLAAHINRITKFDALEYKREAGDMAAETLKEDLQGYNDTTGIHFPDVLEEPGHFIVAKGFNNDTFDINDPYYSRNTLNEGYANTFLSVGRFVPSHTDLSYVMLVSDPGVDLTVLDGSGNKVGDQFMQQPLVNPTDPNQHNSALKMFYIAQPKDGNFKILSDSGDNRSYKITGYLYQADGEVTKETFTGQGTSQFSFYFTKTITYESTIADLSNADLNNLIIHGIANSILVHLRNSMTELLKNNKVNAQQEIVVSQNILSNSQDKIDSNTYQILAADLTALQQLLRN